VQQLYNAFFDGNTWKKITYVAVKINSTMLYTTASIKSDITNWIIWPKYRLGILVTLTALWKHRENIWNKCGLEIQVTFTTLLKGREKIYSKEILKSSYRVSFDKWRLPIIESDTWAHLQNMPLLLLQPSELIHECVEYVRWMHCMRLARLCLND